MDPPVPHVSDGTIDDQQHGCTCCPIIKIEAATRHPKVNKAGQPAYNSQRDIYTIMSFIGYKGAVVVRAEFQLLRSLDDPPASDENYKAGFDIFTAPLRSAQISYSQQMMAFDNAHAVSHLLPEFAVTIVHSAIPVISAAAGAWLHARLGRKVRIKVGDIEAEAASVEEVDRLLQKAIAIRRKLEDTIK